MKTRFFGRNGGDRELVEEEKEASPGRKPAA
jgi:hypothetical protein